MSTDQRQTKELIASRMFRNAAKQWGYNDTELENFDPLVKLLIEACAVEINNINNEISNVQQRILERLATILTPEIYTTSRPSHAILHANPIDHFGIVTPFSQLFLKKKLQVKSGENTAINNVELFYTPAGNYRIFNAKLHFTCCSNFVYRITNQQTKEVGFKSDRSFPAQTLWLGLDIDKRIDTLEDFHLFFDFRNRPDKQNLFNLLPYTKVEINGIKVLTEIGQEDYFKRKSSEDNTYDPVKEFKVTPNIERHTKEFYHSQFLNLVGFEKPVKLSEINRKRYPEEFENTLNTSQLEEFQDDLIWIKLTFASNFEASILDETIVSINCFPVINRKLNEIRYRLQSFINIIPLISDDAFLDINSVKNVSGQTYFENPVEHNSLNKKGTFSVRFSGVERFDHRNSRDLLSYLTELLREESGAYAAFGQDFISSTIKELNENIGLIEKKIQQNNISLESRATFLFIKPYEEGDNIFVDFWTTTGDLGNNVRSGSKLEIYNASEINSKKEVTLMTTTVGGSNRLEGSQLLYAYKNALLSRDRIVSIQDIQNTARQVWGRRLKKSEVKRGVVISELPDEGLVATTDVHLHLNSSDLNSDEIETLKHEFYLKLKRGSEMDARYRIFVNLALV